MPHPHAPPHTMPLAGWGPGGSTEGLGTLQTPNPQPNPQPPGSRSVLPGTPYAAFKCPENHYSSAAATTTMRPAGVVHHRVVRCSECRTTANRGKCYTLSCSGGTADSGGFAKGRPGWWQLFPGEGAKLAAASAAAAPGATAVTAAAAAAAHTAKAAGGG